MFVELGEMRAARIVGKRTATLESAPIPRPAAGEVLFRVEGCGVCASNLGPWLGLPWITYPLRPGEAGHEAWGVVEETGRGVTQFKAGDRVASLSYASYAQFDIAAEGALLRLPSELADKPFPGEPLACAMNAFERSDVREGQTVAIVGVGFLGAVLTRLCASRGARVIAISRRAFSLEMARSFGASELLKIDFEQTHQDIVERVKELTGGSLCERVIEATGYQEPLTLSAELTAVRGKLVVAGYHQDGERRVNMQLWNWRGFDVINAHERDASVCLAGLQRAIEAVASGALDPTLLYTHVLPLERLGEALDLTAERPAGFVKALVLP